MVVRLLSVSDDTELTALHEIFQQVLGWSGQLGHAFRIHGQEFNSLRRRSRAQPLRAFRLHCQEKFLYRYDFLDLWEWDLRVLDVQEGVEQDPLPVCLGGRGAAPPEFCGGPTGGKMGDQVESRSGAVARRLRFQIPLIKPDMRLSRHQMWSTTFDVRNACRPQPAGMPLTAYRLAVVGTRCSTAISWP